MNKTNAAILAGVLTLFAIGAIICFIYAQVTRAAAEEDSDYREDSYTEITSSEESFILEESFTEPEEAPDLPVPITPLSYSYIVIDSIDINELEAELEYCEAQYSLAQAAVESIVALNYDNELVPVLQEDCSNYSIYITQYKERIKELKELKYREQYAEYPAATFIWYYLKEQGWSDIVCAGIMGNIMQEVGGRTLNINYLHSNDYYGICCWKKEYHPAVNGLDLEGQCKYLVDTVVDSLNNSGYLYKDGYNFEAFLAAETIYESANAFMRVYERPGHLESPNRVENGVKAYEYFVGPYTVE